MGGEKSVGRWGVRVRVSTGLMGDAWGRLLRRLPAYSTLPHIPHDAKRSALSKRTRTPGQHFQHLLPHRAH